MTGGHEVKARKYEAKKMKITRLVNLVKVFLALPSYLSYGFIPSILQP